MSKSYVSKGDGKNKFYRLLNVDDSTREAIRLFNKLKKKVLSDKKVILCSKN